MRRRKKNTLLPKMIGIAVLVNAILLPLLAQLGVLKGMHESRLEDVRLVTLPPEKKTPAPKRTPPKKRAARAHPASHAPSRNVASRPSRPNPNQPKVVASSAGPGAGGPAIDNSGTAPAGRLPTAAPAAPPASPPTPPVAPPTVPTPPPTPPVTPTPAPPPVAAPPPHVPVVAQAEPLSQPKPQIPDDLSFDDIHGDFQALFTVRADGTASVQMVSSTGNPRLDNLALDAARRWTFRPGTVDGRPVESYRRLTVQFYAA